MTKISFILQLSKGVFVLFVVGLTIIHSRDFLLEKFGLVIPDLIFQILSFVFLWGALQLGSGKFIAQLKADHEKQKKPDKES